MQEPTFPVEGLVPNGDIPLFTNGGWKKSFPEHIPIRGGSYTVEGSDFDFFIKNGAWYWFFNPRNPKVVWALDPPSRRIIAHRVEEMSRWGSY